MNSPAFEFHHFVALSGKEAQEWVNEYLHLDTQRPAKITYEALRLVRQRKIEAGGERMQEAAVALRSLSGRSPAILAVLDRWYYGALAYYHYCQSDFDVAESFLSLAYESVVAAISYHHFLLPLAHHCHELFLNYARIARNRRNWEEMWHHLDVLHAIMAGRRPLCVLTDGTSVGFSALAEFYYSLGPLKPEERMLLAEQLDPQLRMRLCRRLIQEICITPGFVIPFP